MTLLDTLVAPPSGSINRASVLSTREFRTEKAPQPRVGEIVHVYGPQGVSYYRARVFEVSSRGIRVVGKKNDELLTVDAWKKRVRPEFFDYLLVPGFLVPDAPPELTPEMEKRKSTTRSLVSAATYAVPLVAGAAFGSLVPEIGPLRGASTVAGLIPGVIAGALSGGSLLDKGARTREAVGGTIGSTVAGALVGSNQRSVVKGAAVGAASAAATFGALALLRRIAV
jgi:hypothetical protein